MNCKRAQTEIALWVGDDLDGETERQLERHLVRCAHCREHWRQLETSLRVLHESDESADWPYQSVWPDLSEVLAARGKVLPAEQFNGWLPAFAVAAACLAMLFSSMNRQPAAQRLEHRPLAPTPVGHHPGFIEAPETMWHAFPEYDWMSHPFDPRERGDRQSTGSLFGPPPSREKVQLEERVLPPRLDF